METVSYSNARNNLKHFMDKVCEDSTPLLITRKDNDVVMVSKEDYSAMEETIYLLQSPKNAERLLESVKNIKAGLYEERQLDKD